MAVELSEGEKTTLLATARNTIENRLYGRKQQLPDVTPALEKPYGVFVTLHKSGNLCGCIGYLNPDKALITTVSEAALASAFRDNRFNPVRKGEEAVLKIEISVLSPLKRIDNLEEIEVGTHGIMIEKGYFSGLLLPQVATEHEWDRNTFLANTCRKAGLPGECWKEEDTVINIFDALVFSET